MFKDPLFALTQRALPKQKLTELAGWLANRQGDALTTQAIARFVAHYGVNMAEAAQPDITQYATFNDFFTRALRDGARPLAQANWVSPVDGSISQFGAIKEGQIYQAKGRSYSALALLGGDAALAAAFAQGHFACLYLSPRDYHRIHMPCSASLRQMVYIPGSLYSVNPSTARSIDGLFARNERVVCIFDSSAGPLAMVLVGATIVGSIATVWHGCVTPPRGKDIVRWSYSSATPTLENIKLPDNSNIKEITLAQGEEMGRFMLGSTVILLWPKIALQFNPQLQPGGKIQMGQSMAQRI